MARLRLLPGRAHARGPELGLSEHDIQLARQGTATDPKIAALVAYGRQLAAAPADVTDDQVSTLRKHGYSDEQIAEVVALVALQQLTGTFNLVAGIEPAPEDLAELTSRENRMSACGVCSPRWATRAP